MCFAPLIAHLLLAAARRRPAPSATTCVHVARFRHICVSHSPRPQYQKFTALGFEVYGLSNDNETPLKNWKEKNTFPYSLLSDPKRELIGAL